MFRYALALTAALSILGCQQNNPPDQPPMDGRIAVAHIAPAGAATTQPVSTHVTGTVTFTANGNTVTVVAFVHGLEPNTQHGFHIHEFGDLSVADLSSAGGHFNPAVHMHGGPTTSPVHAGDFGNLQADEQGVARLTLTVDDISIGTGAANDIVGRSVIVHAKADDLQSQPSGNSGARIAGGIILLHPHTRGKAPSEADLDQVGGD